ncbi:hypothetical protein K7X08_006774 [Anisodus acutangulus]|uniref:Poly(A) polymerase nucleotidyltransferase domain-containing protein n=1 Tax=Anisodus acutangulus TaxID=402998 RepID=A0A9Q1MZS0_9SOLA|nr:hypothetical protein K7X08_006774 [Anisodus acutangulus]
MLEEMPEIQELHPATDAHVPVMKFKFNGVTVDLLYANVSLWIIPEDLDMLCLRMLEEMPEIQELHPVTDAHVPVMKFKFNGVTVDLLYANVSLWIIPEV